MFLYFHPSSLILISILKMTIKTLHEVSTGGVLWRMTKVPPG